MIRSFLFVAVVLVASFTPREVSAKQYTRNVHGREVVVHSNPIPVVLHRMVPPQHGRHVTEREIRSGKIPQGTRFGSR
jgi:hypothetical protein